tara:strand:- start:1217 stop:1828 length:612 start_codon:yes stop_codon:yes gene_type:complete
MYGIAARGIGSLLKKLIRQPSGTQVFRVEGSSKLPGVINEARKAMISGGGGSGVKAGAFHSPMSSTIKYFPRGGSSLGNMPIVRSGILNQPQTIVADMRAMQQLSPTDFNQRYSTYRALLEGARKMQSRGYGFGTAFPSATGDLALRAGKKLPVDVIRTLIRNIKRQNFDPSLLQRILKSPEDRATLLKLLFNPSKLAEGGIV